MPSRVLNAGERHVLATLERYWDVPRFDDEGVPRLEDLLTAIRETHPEPAAIT